MTGDLGSVFVGYTVALWATGYWSSHGIVRSSLAILAATVMGFWCLRSQGLFLARVSSIRVMELTRATRAIVLLGALVLLFDRLVKLEVRITAVGVASAITLILLGVWRSGYRSWLTSARAHGRYCRHVIVIGANTDTRRLVDLIATHHELGIVVVGVVGDSVVAEDLGLSALWLGRLDDAERVIKASDVSSVVVSPHDIAAERLNALIRGLQQQRVHVFVATGFSGIDARRIRSLSLAYEPMLYVEAPTLARLQVFAKRIFDMVGSTVGLIVASPIMLVVAAVIKISDRGPVLFCQQRVGFDGAIFGLFKFRTMVVGAESRLADLGVANERNGPLFKMEADPRVTGVGRFLRRTSLDELPQLVNVLKGQMSLVGPRPALPSEVEKFPEGLRAREQVLPGITGLWQVEARDNPSFEAYRRLDLFYVENWSLTLDLFIILGTIEQLTVRLLSSSLSRGATQPQSEVVRSMDAGSIGVRHSIPQNFDDEGTPTPRTSRWR